MTSKTPQELYAFVRYLYQIKLTNKHEILARLKRYSRQNSLEGMQILGPVLYASGLQTKSDAEQNRIIEISRIIGALFGYYHTSGNRSEFKKLQSNCTSIPEGLRSTDLTGEVREDISREYLTFLDTEVSSMYRYLLRFVKLLKASKISIDWFELAKHLYLWDDPKSNIKKYYTYLYYFERNKFFSTPKPPSKDD